MCERGRAGTRTLLAAATFATAVLMVQSAGAALADPCMPVTRNFGLCVTGTAWADPAEDPAGRAEHEQFGDGIVLHLDGFSLDAAEDWIPTGTLRAGVPPAEVLQATLTHWETEVIAEHGQDSFDIAPLGFAVTLRTVLPYGDDAPSLQAVMVAASGPYLLRLALQGPGATPLPEFDSLARDLAGLVRLQAEE